VQADRNVVALDPARFDCDLRQIEGLKPEQLEELSVARMEELAGSFKGGFLEDLYPAGVPRIRGLAACPCG
jgi:hypothetical protein